MTTEWIFLKKHGGNEMGDVRSIGSPSATRRLYETGVVVRADHPLLSRNNPCPEPDDMDLGLLYSFAQMNVGEVETAVADVTDVALLDVVLRNDERVGVKTAVQARIDALVI